MNIKIGILGYGNIGRGVETALRDNPDMELAAVFTRRDPSQVKILSENVPVISVSEMKHGKIDVLYLREALLTAAADTVLCENVQRGRYV
ncbi:MAG: hypothetical protein ACLUIQ_10615 [Dialister invisus]